MKGQLQHWLNLLQDAEWQELRQWLRLPGPARKAKAVTLFGILHKAKTKGAWEPALLDVTALHLALYGKGSVVPQRIRRVMMELQDLVEAFLAGRQALPMLPEAVHEWRVLRLLLDRNQGVLFEDRWKQVQQAQWMRQPLHPDHLAAKLALHRLHNEWVIHSRQQEDTFEAASAALDAHYLSVKLELFSSMRTREKRLPQRHRYSHHDWVLEQAAQAAAPDGELVLLWTLVLRMEEQRGADEVYLQLEQRLAALGGLLQPALMRQFHGYMFNHLSRSQQPSDPGYYRMLWRLMDGMWRSGTLHLHGNISSPFFLAAIRAACLSGEGHWARQFLEQEGKVLVDPERATLLAYLDALVMAQEGRHLEAWRLLLRLRFADACMDALVRVLQLQVAYETQREDEFFRLCDNYLHFIRHKEGLGEVFLRRYTGFGQAARKLGQVRFHQKSPTRQALLQMTEGDIAEALWVRRQLHKLQLYVV